MNLGSECERSEGELSPECVMVWYRWRRWAYRREWLLASSRMVLPELSRMVRDDWVWVWVQTIANGVAEAVANGSRQLGLSLGSDCREWCCWTVANGYRRRFRSYRWRWGSTAIGFGSEARRRLGLGFRGSIGFWFLKNHNWMGLGVLSFLYIY